MLNRLRKLDGAVLNFTNPFYWVSQFELQRVSIRGEATTVEPFLDNLVQMESLFPLIEHVASGILEDIDNLQKHLDNNASSAMRAGLTKQLDALRPTVDITAIRNQYTKISNFIDSYFNSYATYLANADIIVNNDTMTLEQIRNMILSTTLATETSPDDLSALRNASTIEAVPYFESDRQTAPFMGFTDDEASFVFFVNMYTRFGDESYFVRSLLDWADKIDTFFSLFTSGILTMIQDLTSGLETRGRGAPHIPTDIYHQLMGGGDGMGALIAFQNIMTAVNPSLWTMVRSTIVTLRQVRAIFTMFIEEDGVLNQLSLVSYATGMFSSFTTQDGTSFAGNDFHPNVNFLLGWEQEYLLVGDRQERINLDAFNSMLFATRFVFNFISSFVVPTISGMVAGDFTQITRIVFVLGETFVDMLRLRSGNSVPVIKIFNSHWIFGNPKALASAVDGIKNQIIIGTANAAIGGILGATLYPLGIKNELKVLNPGNIYKNGILYVGIARTMTHRGLVGTHAEIIESLGDQFSDNLLADLDLWSSDFAGDFGGALSGDLVTKKIGTILDSDSSIASDEIAKKIADDTFNIITRLISLDYQGYLKVFLFFVPSSVLVDRMQHLIALNMTNTVQNASSPVPPRPTLFMPRPDALPLDGNGLFDLSQAHTAFTLETEVDLHLLFLSSFIAQGRAENVSSGTITFETVSNRGY